MFHGMFAFAIIDSIEQKIILSRDRFGEKPLFYTLDQGTFVFASELKCVINTTPRPVMDLTSVIDYLHFGFVPSPKTIYQNIFKLKPGNFLEYSIAEKRIIREVPFYSLSFNHSEKPFSLRAEEFDEIGARVASQISLADVPIGAFLSGGVDSSGAVYFLNRLNHNTHTFTAGFNSDSFDETVYAKRIVEHLRLKNTTRRVDFDDFVNLYDAMVNHYDEPHNDFSFIPTYIICKEAVKLCKVMISGDGADEIFCGYPRYHKLRQFAILGVIPGAKESVQKLSSLMPSYSNLRRQLYYAKAGPNDFFFRTMSMNFLPEEVLSVIGPVLAQEMSNYSSREIIEDYLAEIKYENNIIQQQRYLDIKMTLSDDMLVKTDRASMANSLEVRPFYLHPLISDFALSLKVNELVSLSTDKVFLKRYFRGKLPSDNLTRSKMGFTFPLKDLIQNQLSGLFNDLVKSLPPEIINKDSIVRLLELQSKGQRNYTAQLHSLMNLGSWIKKNNPSF